MAPVIDRSSKLLPVWKVIVGLLWGHLSTGFVDGAKAEDWWQFRGHSGGHVGTKGMPIRWAGVLDEPLWKVDIPGKGWSSPIVIGDRIWLTSSEETALAENDAQQVLKNRPYGTKDFVVHRTVQLLAVEIDAETGDVLRRLNLLKRGAPRPIHWMNSYASPTPVTDGERLYCHFGSLGTVCVDVASGRIVWTRELDSEEITGGGASPLLWGDCLYLSCDGADRQFVIALDKMTGKTKWQTARPPVQVTDDSHRRSFSTPILIRSSGKEQLVSMGAQWLVSYEPEGGDEIWRARVGTGFAPVPTPVYADDRVYVCTGYPKPDMVAVKTTGVGDVTESGIAWRYSGQVPEIASPLIVGGQLYFVTDGGIATSLDAGTGRELWRERLGGQFVSSPIHAEGRVYFTSTEGKTTVVRPGHKFEALAVNELLSETYATFAVYRSNFLIRTNPFLYCIGGNVAGR